MLSSRLEPISGAGTRVSLGSGAAFAATRDGFFQLGKRAEGAAGSLEGRLGRAAGYGWGRALGLSFGRSDLLGLRLDLNRQTRNGWTPYAVGHRSWRRAGGLQQIGGALLNANLTARLFKLGFSFSHELEHTSTFRRDGQLTPGAESRPLGNRGQRSCSGATAAPSWQAFWAQLLYGDAQRRDDGLYGQMALGTSHQLRRVSTRRYGLNFDRLVPLSLGRLGLQRLERNIHSVEFTRRGEGRSRAKLEHTTRREHRLTLGLPLAPQNFACSLFANLLPQWWYTGVQERRLEANVVFAGSLRRNNSWRALVGNPRAGGAEAQMVQEIGAGRANDELAREFARLHRGIGARADASIEGLAVEERHEQRFKWTSPLHFLPLRQANVSPLVETSKGRGSRTSLCDLDGEERLWPARSTQFRHSHETFRDVCAEINQKTRLHCKTESRALWDGERCRKLQQLTFRTTWTFNGKNEALTDLDPAQVARAVACVNELFGAKLPAPSRQMVRCERKISAAFTVQAADVAALRERLTDKGSTLPAEASRLVPGALETLRRELAAAGDDAAAFEAIGDFIANARAVETPWYATTDVAQAPVLAMDLLRRLLPRAPEVTCELESNHRPAELERAKEVVQRYAGHPLRCDDNLLALRDRAVRVLGATRQLDALWTVHNQDQLMAPLARQNLAVDIVERRQQLRALLRLPAEAGGRAQNELSHQLLSAPWTEADRIQLAQLLGYIGPIPPAKPVLI